MHVRTTRWRAMLAAIGAAVALPAGAGAATPAQIDAAVAEGAAWLETQQQADGSLNGFNGDWAVTTLAAAGVHAADVRTDLAASSLQDWVLDTYATVQPWSDYGAIPSQEPGGNLAKAILIARSGGIDPARLSPSVNLVASLASRYDHTSGTFGNPAANSDGFAALALADLGTLPPSLVDRLADGTRAAQYADGGWTFTPMPGASTDDVDMTGAGLTVLCKAGADATDPQVAAGLAWLKARLDGPTGAFAYEAPWLPRLNTPSNAWALIGLRACDQDPQSAAWTSTGGGNVVDWLLSMQRADGSFKYVPEDGATAPQDTNATEASTRALTGALFSADPPARANPADPVWRPAPAIAPGAPVPVAIAIEDAAGDPRLCAVTVPDRTPLVDVLVAAHDDGFQPGCVEDVAAVGGVVTALNGVGAGGTWQLRVDGVDAGRAGEQEIGFGDVVWLRWIAHPAPSPVPTASEPPVERPHPTPPTDRDQPSQNPPATMPPVAARGRAADLSVPKKVLADRRGRFAIAVTCPEGAATCTATLRVKAKLGGEWRTLAAREVTIPAAADRTLRLRIAPRHLRAGAVKLRIAQLVDGDRRGPARKTMVSDR